MNRRFLTDAELDDWSLRVSSKISKEYKHPKNKVELIGPIPVSHQANSSEKKKVKSFLQNQTKKIPWVFLGDVSINVQWYINDRVRYENDYVPDIDNVLKPILDSISGKSGILVDDCQIINVNISQLGGWIEGYERFDLEIRALEEFDFNWAWKKSLRFITIKNGICWPITNDLYTNHDELKEMLLKYIDSENINDLPIQRFYHISRLKSWDVIK